jgi:hypothetical protein
MEESHARVTRTERGLGREGEGRGEKEREGEGWGEKERGAEWEEKERGGERRTRVAQGYDMIYLIRSPMAFASATLPA